jgi:amino acid transporter
LGDTGAKAMSVLVMISALGAINGLIYTGSRVYSSMGSDHSVFALLGRWNPTFGVPVWALLVQSLIAVAFVFSVGSETGPAMINAGLEKIRVQPIPWKDYFGGFQTLFAGTAPVFWSFFLLSGLAFFKLRWIDPHIERPFRLVFPFYPLLPLIFCGTCAFGIWASAKYAGIVSLLGVVPLLVGLPLYCISANRGTLAQVSDPLSEVDA